MTARLPRRRTLAAPARFAARWRELAACRGTDLEVFFPERGESAEPARQVCAACPVRQPCLDYAITNRITHGIWGGLTERERRALRSGWVRASRRERDRAILAAEAAGYTAAAIGRSFGLSRTSVTRIVRDRERRGPARMSRAPGSRVIAFATWLLALLGAGLMYVSFDAQYQFILAQKGVLGASMIEAAMLDAGMVILSALGIGLAQAGKPSGSVRVLIMICAGASAGMNLAAADPASWRSVAAYVSAPVFLAVITDRVIAVIRQHVLPLDAESAWAPLGRAAVIMLRLAGVVALYLLRTMLAPSGTLRGLRQMVLDAAPVPGMTDVRRTGGEPLPCPAHDHEIPGHGSGQPSEDKHAAQVSADADGRGAGQPVTGFGTKKAAFLSRYRAHPEYGNRSAAGRVAAELAPLAGLQAGTGRTYIAEELRKLTGMADPRPAEEGR